MAGDVDPLRPLVQRQSEPALFSGRAILRPLQPDQIGQPRADALAVALRALLVGAAGEGEGLVEALQGAGHRHRYLPCRVAVDLLVEAPVDDPVVHAVDVPYHLVLKRGVPGALYEETARLRLPVGEEHQCGLSHLVALEVVRIVVRERALRALQVPGIV